MPVATSAPEMSTSAPRMRGGASSDWRDGIVAVFYGIDMGVSRLRACLRGLRTRHAVSHSGDYSPHEEFGETERGGHDCNAPVSIQVTPSGAARRRTGGTNAHHDHPEHDGVLAPEAI